MARNSKKSTPAPVATPVVVATPAPVAPVAPKAPRNEFPVDAQLVLTGTAHGCRPGSKRGAIMDRIFALVGEGATAGACIKAAASMGGGAEDLRILASKGCITLPAGVTPAPTRAMRVKLAGADEATPAAAAVNA